MLNYLFAIFLPIKSFKRLMPIFGVLVTLSVGIGVFWMIQSLMGNYLDGIIQIALVSKEEIAIVKNPDRTYMTEEELDEEIFSGKKMDIALRTKISREKLEEIKKLLKNVNEVSAVEGVCKKANFELIEENAGHQRHYKPLFIAADISPDNRVLPLFDALSEKQIADFMNNKGEKIPFLATQKLFPHLKTGDTIILRRNENAHEYICAGVIEQHELFSIPQFIVSTNSMEKILGEVKFDMVAVRTNHYKSLSTAESLESVLGDGYLVSHWSKMLKPLYSVFNSINVIISAIVSSLFIMAFFFSISTFDIMIKKRRQHLALLLALGMKPKKIRQGLALIGCTIGAISMALGFVWANLFLLLIPHTPLKHVFSQMFLSDFSLRYDPAVLALMAGMTFIVTVVSALLSARRIFKIDPVLDLKK